MARIDSLNARRYGAGALFGLLLALVALPAFAQASLPRLHVNSFTLSADRRIVGVGQPFHVTIAAQVAERIDDLAGVSLPYLAAFEIVADERHTLPDGTGTRFVEQLTLRPTRVGRFHISPASFEAVDAATNRPSLFSTNALIVDVTLAPITSAPSTTGALSETNGNGVRHAIHRIAAVIAAFLAIVAALILAAFAVLRRRRRPTGTVTRVEPVVPVAPPSAPPASALAVQFDLDDPVRLRMMIAQLAAQPSRTRVLTLRELLRLRAGAREDETFGDLAARYAQTEYEPLIQALRGLERAAFITDEHLAQAIHESLGSLDYYVSWIEAKRR
ncbi:MAG: BatD family protein [Vulcanimicrobiaceae bacterium]